MLTGSWDLTLLTGLSWQWTGRVNSKIFSIPFVALTRQKIHLLATWSSATGTHNTVYITPEARLDASWLMRFLPVFNGVTLMKPGTAERVCFVDACLTGGGGGGCHMVMATIRFSSHKQSHRPSTRSLVWRLLTCLWPLGCGRQSGQAWKYSFTVTTGQWCAQLIQVPRMTRWSGGWYGSFGGGVPPKTFISWLRTDQALKWRPLICWADSRTAEHITRSDSSSLTSSVKVSESSRLNCSSPLSAFSRFRFHDRASHRPFVNIISVVRLSGGVKELLESVSVTLQMSLRRYRFSATVAGIGCFKQEEECFQTKYHKKLYLSSKAVPSILFRLQY